MRATPLEQASYESRSQLPPFKMPRDIEAGRDYRRRDARRANILSCRHALVNILENSLKMTVNYRIYAGFYNDAYAANNVAILLNI